MTDDQIRELVNGCFVDDAGNTSSSRIEKAIRKAIYATWTEAAGVCRKQFDEPDLRDPDNRSYREGYEDGTNDCAEEILGQEIFAKRDELSGETGDKSKGVTR